MQKQQLCKKTTETKMLRVHCAVLKQQTRPTTGTQPGTHPPQEGEDPHTTHRRCGNQSNPTTQPGHVIPQDPTVCPPNRDNPHQTTPGIKEPPGQDSRRSTSRHTHSGHQPHNEASATTRCVLLRKEVIQPHLPVRLPCYDFVPIASPTFDGSLPQGVGPPASGVADFRDVTGGVYKARERIHRSVADLRLLATPTSWGRVADPNPN